MAKKQKDELRSVQEIIKSIWDKLQANSPYKEIPLIAVDRAAGLKERTCGGMYYKLKPRYVSIHKQALLQCERGIK